MDRYIRQNHVHIDLGLGKPASSVLGGTEPPPSSPDSLDARKPCCHLRREFVTPMHSNSIVNTCLHWNSAHVRQLLLSRFTRRPCLPHPNSVQFASLHSAWAVLIQQSICIQSTTISLLPYRSHLASPLSDCLCKMRPTSRFHPFEISFSVAAIVSMQSSRTWAHRNPSAIFAPFLQVLPAPKIEVLSPRPLLRFQVERFPIQASPRSGSLDLSAGFCCFLATMDKSEN